MHRGSFPFLETDSTYALNAIEFDPILRKYGDKIGGFTWITFVGDKHSDVSYPTVMDMSRLYQNEVGIYGVMPNVFDIGDNSFMTVFHQESGLKLGE